LPYSTDQSDANHLPDPELNPLLNPLLGANMGRWAEVYFTNPPEKREQAVAELLRELRQAGESSSNYHLDEASDQVSDQSTDQCPNRSLEQRPIQRLDRNLEQTLEQDPEQRPAQRSTPSAPLQASPAAYAPTAIATAYPAEEHPALELACRECGHRNPPLQKFCGMCGATLPDPAIYADIRRALPTDAVPPDGSEPVTSLHEHTAESSPAPEVVSPESVENRERDYDASEPTWQQNDIPSFAMGTESVPYRYRVYVGAALVILLAALIYMAWRGTASRPSAAGLQSVPARAIPDAPGTSSPPVASAPSAEKPPVLPVEGQSASPTASREGNQAQAQPPDEAPEQSKNPEPDGNPPIPAPRGRPAAARPAPRMVPVTARSPAATENGGGEEFVMAQKYLSGASGMPRDSRQAAEWLWRAVRKENPAATLALADLYLHGDGVTKNCDQARLLLDASARKGVAGAAQRLRNLQAFGCQ